MARIYRVLYGFKTKGLIPFFCQCVLFPLVVMQAYAYPFLFFKFFAVILGISLTIQWMALLFMGTSSGYKNYEIWRKKQEPEGS